MKKLLLLLIFFTIHGCGKPKTVLICGDHVCVNKAEANQYFEDNLTLEVKIIDNKETTEDNLVEINLSTNSEGKKEINILDKKQTSKRLKELSVFEIKNKKADLKKRKKVKKKQDKTAKITREAKLKKKNNIVESQVKVVNEKKDLKKNVTTKQVKKIDDICTILKKCNIEEITKYLVEQGTKKKYPNIANREIK